MEILIAIPFILYFLKERNADSYKVVLAFFIYTLISKIALMSPLYVPELRFMVARYNWSGKVYAIITSIIFLIVYRKYTLKDYFITFKQNPKFIKKGISYVLIFTLLVVVSDYFFSSTKDWHTETILYQATMPGLDEELMYRGIMMGLLMKILRPNIGKLTHILFHPALLITSMMFGLTHGFRYTHQGIGFDLLPALATFIIGWFFAWLTVRSGSILLAILAHNLTNTGGQLIRMR